MRAYTYKIIVCSVAAISLLLAAGCGNSRQSEETDNTAATGMTTTEARPVPAGIESSAAIGNIEDETDEIDIKDIAYNGSELYVAITSDGAVLASADGLSWTEKQDETGMWLEAAAWGNGRFVIVGGEGMILASEDGVNWTQKDSGTDAYLHDVMWDGYRFIAVGSKTLLTSPDGEEWRYSEVPEIDPENGTSGRISLFYGGVFWDGNQYFTGGSGNYLLASEDLDQWTVISGDSPGSGMYYGFAWNGNRYVAVGDHFEIITSEDGRNWTKEGLNVEFQDGIDDYDTLCINSVVWGKEKFVAVGHRGLILVSDNGLDWSVIPPVTRAGLNRVIWDGRQYIAAGNKNTIVTSINGIDWKQDQLQR